ncbi:MAG: hypothetical protein K0S32_3323 [Bacteroidetes bacterium]|jgi:hypothetical protein|nr:hypothetical protein [Bacteroidota bacterium]
MKLFTKVLFSFFLVLTGSSIAQNKIEGAIVDDKDQPSSFCALALLKSGDSSQVKGNITDADGKFSFEAIPSGTFIIKASASGFDDGYSGVIIIDSLSKINLEPIVLKTKAVNLNEVAVTVIRKPVEFKNGNIVMNVQDSPIAIGNTVYDLLTKLPGVSIVDDVISIQGKGGVRIMIDDRIQQLPAAALINMLRSMNSSNVDKIEILKNPPAKYDAAGSAMINIKLKKVKLTGFSGSTYVNYMQGFYSIKDGGLSLNYKGRNFAVFSNFTSGYNEYRYYSDFTKRVTFNNTTTEFHQLTGERNANLFYTYNGGADWYINKRNTVGFKIDGGEGTFTSYRSGNNYLSDNTLGYKELEFGSTRPNNWRFLNININSEHKLDSSGTLLKISADYSPNGDVHKGDFQNYFLDSLGNNALYPTIFKTNNKLDYVFYSARIDFEKPLSKTSKFETGVKANQQSMLSDILFQTFDHSSSTYKTDSVYTNVFQYREQISAAYINFQKEYKKFNFYAGLRGENTLVEAESKTSGFTFTRQYFNLFPVASIDYNASQKNSFTIAYNRRIDRPGFTQFNPYKFFMNLFVSFEGNPYLMPQYNNSLEFSHNYKGSLFNTVYLSKVHHSFYGYPVQNDSTKESLNRTSNLDNLHIIGYNVYYQKDITKWWFAAFSGNISLLEFNGNVEGNTYGDASYQYYAFLNSVFTLPQKIKFEINANIMAENQVVIYVNQPKWQVDFALKKSFLKEKMNLVVGMNDIFFTMVNRNTVRYRNISSELFNTSDTRRFKVNLSYNFGKIKVQQRKTKSNEEEKRRLSH